MSTAQSSEPDVTSDAFLRKYADNLGISLDQAEENMRLQAIAMEFHEEVQELMGSDYGGVEFLHRPKFSVRVYVPQNADPSALDVLTKEYPEFTTEFSQVRYSEIELQEQLRRAAKVVKGLDLSSGALLTDVAGERVILQVPSGRIDDAWGAVQTAALSSQGPRVEVEERNTFDILETSGGQDAGDCSVAFSVRSISTIRNDFGRLGVATAGHCQTNGHSVASHPEMPGMSYAFPGIINDHGDVTMGVASASNADYDDRVRTFGSYTASISTVGGNVARGQVLCHRGDPFTDAGTPDAPDWSCAWAYTNSYCPIHFSGCDSSPTSFDGYMVLLLDPWELIGDGGDSGSPYVNLPSPLSAPTVVAYGIHSGSSNEPNPTWDESYTFGGLTCPSTGCDNASYTAAHWLDDDPVSLQVLTTSPPTCNGHEVTHWGTSGADTILGTSGEDVIHASGGDDFVLGGLGDDIICGGSGEDVLHGGSHNDELYGDGGDDTLVGQPGTDECHGSAGQDTADSCETTSGIEDGDELLLYESGGDFSYYDVSSSGSLGAPFLAGMYSSGWDIITALDLQGDGDDELLFYDAADGTFRYYNVSPSGSLGSPINQGDGYSSGWDTIAALDLNGDGDDELLFYNSGTFTFYDISSSATLGSPISQGTGWSSGWDIITGLDLQGDGDDELLFYDSGTYKFYNVSSSGSIGSPIAQGTGWSSGWDTITSIDLEGVGNDELLFYNSGTYAYYNISSSASLGSPISQGTGYSPAWDVITAPDLD